MSGNDQLIHDTESGASAGSLWSTRCSAAPAGVSVKRPSRWLARQRHPSARRGAPSKASAGVRRYVAPWAGSQLVTGISGQRTPSATEPRAAKPSMYWHGARKASSSRGDHRERMR